MLFRSLCQSHPLLFGSNLRFHLENHLCQQLLTVFSGFGIDIAGVLFAVRPDGEVAALPQAVVDLGSVHIRASIMRAK